MELCNKEGFLLGQVEATNNAELERETNIKIIKEDKWFIGTFRDLLDPNNNEFYKLKRGKWTFDYYSEHLTFIYGTHKRTPQNTKLMYEKTTEKDDIFSCIMKKSSVIALRDEGRRYKNQEDTEYIYNFFPEEIGKRVAAAGCFIYDLYIARNDDSSQIIAFLLIPEGCTDLITPKSVWQIIVSSNPDIVYLIPIDNIDKKLKKELTNTEEGGIPLLNRLLEYRGVDKIKTVKIMLESYKISLNEFSPYKYKIEKIIRYL